MAVAWQYNEGKNKNGAFFGGVPLADITDEQFKALPKWIQAQVKDSEMYTQPGATSAQKKKSGKKNTASAVRGKGGKFTKNVEEKPQEAPQAPVVALEQPIEGEE